MTGNQLKILALVTMTIDHIGVILLPQYPILRIIGRLAFPIFAYMIAEGCYFTRSKPRYLGGIVALAIACQVVFFFAMGSLEQSILTTLALGIVTIYAMQFANEHRGLAGACAVAGAVVLDFFACDVLRTLLVNTDYSVDYGFWGALLPAICYLPRILFPDMDDAPRRHITLGFCALGLALVSLGMHRGLATLQWWSLLALVPLAFYNGERGKWRMKYLFYIYYPLHLVVIQGISMLV